VMSNEEIPREFTAYGVRNPINNHPAFQAYLNNVMRRDRTLSDAFNAGLTAIKEQDDKEMRNGFAQYKKANAISRPPVVYPGEYETWKAACEWLRGK